jgi:hypothetical protein
MNFKIVKKESEACAVQCLVINAETTVMQVLSTLPDNLGLNLDYRRTISGLDRLAVGRPAKDF